MEIYINGIALISPQKTFEQSGFLTELIHHNLNYLRCVEPSYKEFVNPVAARRMSRILKMSMAAAKTALKQAAMENVDAIISGTGLGLMEDTETFLISMLENEEKFLQPTSFIQSTHNTVSGQVAIAIKCTGYNSTYSHRGFSFESALLDGMLLINDKDINSALIAGFDEITEKYFVITQKTGAWKKDSISNFDLLKSKTKGTITGEGVGFFAISNQIGENTHCCINDIAMLFKPESNQDIISKFNTILTKNNLCNEDIDLVITGINGDSANDLIYEQTVNTIFSNSIITYYKHLCGDYHTSSAFALWLAAMILKTQEIPETIIIHQQKREKIKNILIYNHLNNVNHSFILVSGVN